MGGKKSETPPPQIIHAPAAGGGGSSAFADMLAQQQESNRLLQERLFSQDQQSAEDEARAKAIADRDSQYQTRNQAISDATSQVEQQIQDERSRAQLLGTDYEVTAEQRQERINSAFASLWNQEQENALISLRDQYGAPGGEASAIALGSLDYESILAAQEASTSATGEGEEGQVGGAVGQTLLTQGLLEEDEEENNSPIGATTGNI